MGLVSSALCCACQAISCSFTLLGCCCSVASATAGGISVRAANFFTLIMLGVVTALSLTIRFFADDWAWEDIGGVGLIDVTICSGTDDENNIDITGTTEIYAYCQGDVAAYRIAVGFIVVLALGLVMTACGTAFHRGFWMWKILLVMTCCIGSLFVPPELFDEDAYVSAARVISVLFIVVQLFLVLMFAYDWNDKWVSNAYDNGANETCWLGAVLVSAALLYVSSLIGIGLLYAYYPCGTTITTITLFSVIAFTILTLFRDKITGVEGAVLPSAVVSAYIVFLAWSALEGEVDETCKPSHGSLQGGGGVMALGIAIATLSIMWLANSTASTAKSIFSGGHASGAAQQDKKAPTLVYEVGEGRTGEDMRREQEETVEPTGQVDPLLGESGQVAVFYFVLIITTVYQSMVVTDYGSAEVRTEANSQFWVKVGSQWLTSALFIWTLVAPACLTGRDFSNDEPQPRRAADPGTNVAYV